MTGFQRPQSQRMVEFFTSVIENKAKSKEQGWACYDEKLMIRAYSASADGKLDGDYVEHVATPRDLQMHQAEYQAFVMNHGKADGYSGTLLNYLPFLSLARQQEWKAAGIYTVEQLAEAPKDIKLGAAAASEIEQAKAYLQALKDTALVSKQAARVSELEKLLADALEENKQLAAEIKKIAEKKEKKDVGK